MTWETVIGLEVHVQLATKSKIFSGAATAFGAKPNTQACAIDLGLPGVLPVLNAEAVRMALKFGLAIEADIAEFCQFDRKNYFYPDLPKGYQISQLDHPIVGKGHLDIPLTAGEYKRITITRAHLEEDAGKSLHSNYPNASGIDLNRAGTPLLEVVSEPELRSASEAVSYLKTLHTLVRYLDICDGNMQEGSFRCDVNISIRPEGEPRLGTRSEIKNLNSFRFVEKAIHYEVERQIELLESGQSIQQETRLYDADKDCTQGMRSKEEANDYRYFPDPDLLPLKIEAAMVDDIRQSMPELPAARVTRFIDTLELKKQDAQTLVNSKSLADFFEHTLEHGQSPANLVANWVLGNLSAALNQDNRHCQDSPIGPRALAQLLDRISDKTISGKIAKTVFEAMWTSGKNADAIIEEQGLKQVTDDALIEKIVDRVIADNPEQVKQYQLGKEKVFGFFVGQVMKASQGKANPGQVNQLLKAKLG